MFAITVTSYIRHLANLKSILEKAKSWQEEKKISDDAIVNSRLALDQFPFAKQVQITCDYAKKSGAFLCGVENPVFEDNEKTLAELIERIDKTVRFLVALPSDKVAENLETEIMPIQWMPGKGITKKYYIEDYAHPQFYFHYTVAYSILRHYGLTIGKGDFMGPIDLRDIA